MSEVRRVGTGPGAAARVARIALLRTWRALTDGDRTTLKLGVVGLVGLCYIFGGGVGGFFYGEAVARPAFDKSLLVARGAVLVGVFFASTTALQRTVKQVGRPDHAAGVLTAASHRAVAAGLLAAELGRYLGLTIPVFLAIGLGMALGAGSALVALTAVVVLVATVVLGVSVGFTVGLVAKTVAETSSFVQRHRSAINLLSAFAFPIGYAVVWSNDVQTLLAAAQAGGRAIPVAWLGDLALAPVRGTGSLAAGGVATALGLSGLAVLGSFRAAGTLWFRTPTPGRDEQRADTRLGDLDLPALGGLSRTTRVVAVKSLLRAKRAPFTVQYTIVPVFFLFAEAFVVIRTGRLPGRLPVEVAVAGAVAIGSAFTLNPIGNEGPVLPATLTSGVDGRAFVAGLASAELLVGVPATLVLTLLAGLVAPLPVSTVAVIVLWAAALCVASTGLAARFGARYPNTDPTTMGQGRDVIVPSPWAFTGYLCSMLVLSLPAVLASVPSLATWLADRTVLTAPGVRLAGLALSLGLVGLCGYGGFARAAETVETYAD